jgi:hypothetical protein
MVFESLMRRYGVDELPALVLVGRDGHHGPPIEGARDLDELAWVLPRAKEGLDKSLFWRKLDAPHPPGKLTVLAFGSQWLLPKSGRTDWREFPSPDFAEWAATHLDLVGGNFDSRKIGMAHYKTHGIREVPTLVVVDSDGRELGRFVGFDAVQDSPERIARLAREHGLEVPDPPQPYATGVTSASD